MEQAKNEGETFECFRRPGADGSPRDSMKLFDAATDGAVVLEFYLEESQKLDFDKVQDYVEGGILACKSHYLIPTAYRNDIYSNGRILVVPTVSHYFFLSVPSKPS